MIIPVGFAQLNYRFAGAALPFGAQITLGADITGAGTAQDVADAAVIAWNTGNMDSYYVPSVSLVGIDVKFGPNETGPSATGVTASPGSGPTESSPPNTAALIQKQTALGGHAGRGRLYFPGIPESQITSGGVLSTTWIDGLDDEWGDMAILLAAANIEPVVLHGPGSPIITPTPITAFVTEAQVATQRRRNRR